MTRLGEGLHKLATDTPVRSGYLEALGGHSSLGGPFARAELGLRPAPGFSVFGFGEASRAQSMAGAGLRWEFDW